MSKGSRQRKVDQKKFDEAFQRIFGDLAKVKNDSTRQHDARGLGRGADDRRTAVR